MSTTVLVINSGSSSIKYQLIEPDAGVVVASGLVERIGEEAGHLRHTFEGQDTTLTEPIADHGDGLRRVLELFGSIGPDLRSAGIVAVGHRVVQGGRRYSSAVLVDERTDRFDFDDTRTVTNEIRKIRLTEFPPHVSEFQRRLRHERDTAIPELDFKAFLINRF